jgi:hypothetical protein
VKPGIARSKPPNGITLTDLDGKLLLCNQQTASLHGYENPECAKA